MPCPSCQADNEPGATVCRACGASLAGPQPGSVVASRYEIVALLGKGGMGMVFKARDRVLDEIVALKVLRTDMLESAEMAQRFRGEIRLARKITHKNVCRIHEYGEDGGLRYISMQYVDGVDLKHVLRTQGPLPPHDAYAVAQQVCRGLEAIHEEGILHRDLKAANIMRDARGVVRLMDFGIAKEWSAEGAQGMTATGMIVGTPEYMSPEQAQGRKLDLRSDLYSMGVVTFELFSGDVPFRGETPIATIIKQIQQPPPLDGPEAARLPQALVPILRRALAKSPAERFGSSGELAEALARAQASTASSAPSPTRTAALPRELPEHQPTPTPTAVPTLVPTHVPTRAAATLASSPPPRPRARETPAVALAPARPAWLWPLVGVALVAVTALVVVAAVVLVRGQGGPAHGAAGRDSAPPATAAEVRAPVAAPAVSPTAAAATASQPRVPTSRPTPVALKPLASPPPSPGVVAPKAEAGYLLIVVVPWADATVDGAKVETGVLKRTGLAPGKHLVRLTHPDYEPLLRTVTIRAGETTRLSIDLPEEAVRKKP